MINRQQLVAKNICEKIKAHTLNIRKLNSRNPGLRGETVIMANSKIINSKTIVLQAKVCIKETFKLKKISINKFPFKTQALQ